MSYPGVRFIHAEIFNSALSVALGPTFFTSIFDIAFTSQIFFRYRRTGNPAPTFTFQTADTVAFPVAADFNNTSPLAPRQSEINTALTSWYINNVTARYGRFMIVISAGTGTGRITVCCK